MTSNSSQSAVIDSDPTELAWSQNLTEKKRVHKVVLTGGPCGGKSTCQTKLAEFFRGLGWKVMVVPETATIIYNGSITKAEQNPQQRYNFQRDLLTTMISLENVYMNLARYISDKDVLVICDRGFIDPSTYCSREVWTNILDELKLNPFLYKNGRYDQVVHMVTAADGAAEHYSLANNMARRENIKQAIEQDQKAIAAWSGHQCVSVVRNPDNFDEKVKKVIQVVCDRAGVHLDQPLAQPTKKIVWKLRSFSTNKLVFTSNYQEFTVEEFSVDQNKNNANANVQELICKTNQEGATCWSLIRRTYVAEIDDYVESKRDISSEFEVYRKMTKTSMFRIFKNRFIFTFHHNSFTLDVFDSPETGKTLIFMETYTSLPAEELVADEEFSECFDIKEEIFGIDQYPMFKWIQDVKLGNF